MNLGQLWEVVRQRYPGQEATRHQIAAAKATRDEQKWLALPSGEFRAFLTGSPSIECERDTEIRDVSGRLVTLTCPRTRGATGSLLDGNIGKFLPIHGVVLRLDMQLIQPVYTFGKLKTARDLGTVGVDLAKSNAASSEADLGLNLVRAYYGLKTARSALAIVKEGQEQIVHWLKRIDHDLEEGKGNYSEIDLMRLKVADAQVDLSVVDIDRQVKSTLKALQFLAQDPAADTDEDELILADVETQDVGHYLDAALKGRPELRTLELTGRGAALYSKLRFAELLPDLAVVFNFNYYLATGVTDTKSDINPLGVDHAFMNRANSLGAALGLVLRQPLDLGPRISRLQRARADVLQYQARRREALGGGALEIERAFNDLTEARGRLRAAESAERRARGWLQGVKQAIDVGTAESRDMIDALRTYFEQRILVLRTINDVNVLSAALRRIAGLAVIPPRSSKP